MIEDIEHTDHSKEIAPFITMRVIDVANEENFKITSNGRDHCVFRWRNVRISAKQKENGEFHIERNVMNQYGKSITDGPCLIAEDNLRTVNAILRGMMRK